MDAQFRQRLLGAVVLVGLGVIFIPLVLDRPVTQPPVPRAQEVEPPEDIDPTFALPEAVLPPAAPLTPVKLTDPDRKPPQVTPPGDARPRQTETRPGAAATATATAVAANQPAVVESNTAAKPTGAAEETTPAAKPDESVAAGKAWVVQVASFAHKANAERLQRKLAQNDYKAFLNPGADGPAGKVIYRVQVGPELVRERAQELQQALQKDLGPQSIIVPYP